MPASHFSACSSAIFCISPLTISSIASSVISLMDCAYSSSNCFTTSLSKGFAFSIPLSVNFLISSATARLFSPCRTLSAIFFIFFSSSICPCDCYNTYLTLILIIFLANSASAGMLSSLWFLKWSIEQEQFFLQE